MPRWLILVLFVLLLVAPLMAPLTAKATSLYSVGYYYNEQLSISWLEETTDYLATLDWNPPDDNNGSHLRSRRARAGQGFMTGYYWTYKHGSWTVNSDQHPYSRVRFDDLVFTCSDGSSGFVSVSLNLDFSGTFVYDPPAAEAPGTQGGHVSVQCYLRTASSNSGDIGGTWVPTSGDGAAVSNGIFTGMGADAISGVFTTSAFNVPLNVPVTLELFLLTRVENCCEPVVIVSGQSALKFAHESTGPVFNFQGVPGGVTCTVNSTQADIMDNVWRSTVATEESTWGGIKALYR